LEVYKNLGAVLGEEEDAEEKGVVTAPSNNGIDGGEGAFLALEAGVGELGDFH